MPHSSSLCYRDQYFWELHGGNCIMLLPTQCIFPSFVCLFSRVTYYEMSTFLTWLEYRYFITEIWIWASICFNTRFLEYAVGVTANMVLGQFSILTLPLKDEQLDAVAMVHEGEQVLTLMTELCRHSEKRWKSLLFLTTVFLIYIRGNVFLASGSQRIW